MGDSYLQEIGREVTRQLRLAAVTDLCPLEQITDAVEADAGGGIPAQALNDSSVFVHPLTIDIALPKH